MEKSLVHLESRAAAAAVPRTDSRGLSSHEARRRLAAQGPNEIAESSPNPLLSFLRKFWAPVPWMLEVAVVLELALGKFDEAAVIAALLVLNALLAFAQEGRADRALDLLRGRLSARARSARRTLASGPRR